MVGYETPSSRATAVRLPPASSSKRAMYARSSPPRSGGCRPRRDPRRRNAPARRQRARRPGQNDAPGIDRLSGRQDHRALDHVAQLAHVARAVRRPAGLACSAASRATRLAHARSRPAPRKCAAERRDVLAPLAQRRHAHVEHVEPVDRGPRGTRPALDLAGQLPVGRGDDAHVDLTIARRRPAGGTSLSSSTRSSFACSRQRHARRSRRGTASRRRPPRTARASAPWRR